MKRCGWISYVDLQIGDLFALNEMSNERFIVLRPDRAGHECVRFRRNIVECYVTVYDSTLGRWFLLGRID